MSDATDITKAIQEYVDEYEMDDGESIHYTPSEHEKTLILDAMMGFENPRIADLERQFAIETAAKEVATRQCLDRIGEIDKLKAQLEKLQPKECCYKFSNCDEPNCVPKLKRQLTDITRQAEDATEYVLAQINADLKQQLAEAQKDAKRYRWLRDINAYYMPGLWSMGYIEYHGYDRDGLDDAIDAAIGKSQVASEPPIGKLKAAPESPDSPEAPTE